MGNLSSGKPVERFSRSSGIVLPGVWKIAGRSIRYTYTCQKNNGVLLEADEAFETHNRSA
jgi:hypothetical protein